MQQVKSEAFLAGARIVDPRALPVPVRSPRNRLARSYSRAWVMHRKGITRSIAAVALLAALGIIYQVREPIGSGLAIAGGVAQGEFAEAGFALNQLRFTGQSLTTDQAIFDALGIQPNTSSVTFDVEAARQRVAELPAVATVSVRKNYPAHLLVEITEKVPVARWRVDGITFVIDATGLQIGEANGLYGDLPLVIGDGAADDALVMVRALQQFPTLENGLLALSRIADRRWDLIYETGLRIQLPEHGVARALRHLDMYHADYQLLDRDLSVIDLRVDNLVALRPNKPAEDQEADNT